MRPLTQTALPVHRFCVVCKGRGFMVRPCLGCGKQLPLSERAAAAYGQEAGTLYQPKEEAP